MTKEKLFITFGILVTVGMLVAAVFLLSGSSDQGSSANQAVNTPLNDLIGKSAPDFTLESYNGDKTTLSSLKGKNVVLFFSEGLMCYPACWDQIVSFAKDNSKFTDKNISVLTIINDPKNDWKQAIDKMPELAPANVLFDTDKRVAIAYNTLSLPSSMHKGSLPGHTYFVIDKLPRTESPRFSLKVYKKLQKTLPSDTTDQSAEDCNHLSIHPPANGGWFSASDYKESIVRFVKDDPQMAIRNDEILGEAEKL